MGGIFLMGAFFGAGIGFMFALWYMLRPEKETGPKRVCTEIRVPATWLDNDDNGPIYNEAFFKLGLGPCGKEATELLGFWDDSETIFTVKQTCGDEVKYFYYLASHITGRVAITYEMR